MFVCFRTSIAAVSPTIGVVCIDTKEQVTNIDRFHPFIKKLSAKMNYRPFALFMD